MLLPGKQGCAERYVCFRFISGYPVRGIQALMALACPFPTHMSDSSGNQHKVAWCNTYKTV